MRMEDGRGGHTQTGIVKRGIWGRNAVGVMSAVLAAVATGREGMGGDGIMHWIRVVREVGGPEFGRLVTNRENEFREGGKRRGFEVNRLESEGVYVWERIKDVRKIVWDKTGTITTEGTGVEGVERMKGRERGGGIGCVVMGKVRSDEERSGEPRRRA